MGKEELHLDKFGIKISQVKPWDNLRSHPKSFCLEGIPVGKKDSEVRVALENFKTPDNFRYGVHIETDDRMYGGLAVSPWDLVERDSSVPENAGRALEIVLEENAELIGQRLQQGKQLTATIECFPQSWCSGQNPRETEE